MTESTKRKGRQTLPEQNKPLSNEALQARREYFREYNRKNREKRKQWTKNHWEKVAAQNAEERQED